MTDLAERRGLDEDVYQPAEDSRLLASAVVDDIERGERVLDVGTGSGFVAASVAEETGATVLGTDVNPHACRQAAGRGVEAIRADLLDPIAADAVDVVASNPPYLPTDVTDDAVEAAQDDWMSVALSGGDSGLAVIEPLLEDVDRVLRPSGRVLLLVSSLTGVEDVVDLAATAGFSAVAVAENSYPYETLTVLKLVR